jgi:hypothetical protein
VALIVAAEYVARRNGKQFTALPPPPQERKADIDWSHSRRNPIDIEAVGLEEIWMMMDLIVRTSDVRMLRPQNPHLPELYRNIIALWMELSLNMSTCTSYQKVKLRRSTSPTLKRTLSGTRRCHRAGSSSTSR